MPEKIYRKKISNWRNQSLPMKKHPEGPKTSLTHLYTTQEKLFSIKIFEKSYIFLFS